MAIKSNALAENKAAILAEDGGTIYATLQMRHGKESEMDESKFVPAEIGVATDTKKAVIAFGPGDTKEFAFKDDIPDQDYNNLENKPSIGGVELSGDKSLEQLGIQQKGDYITEIPAEYVTDTKLTEKLKSYPTKEEQAEELEKKLDKDQGAENTGKALVVGEDGTVKPGEIPIKVDDTLSQTGQAADAEKVGARLHEIDAVKLRGPVETVSGEILQIENPAEQPPVGMRVYGKAEQNTTTGAQLLNAPDKTNKIFGVTMSVSGGIASFSGTLSSNNATFWFIGSYNGTDVVMTLPAGRYYLQNCSMQTLGNSALKTGAITSETEIQITGVAYTYTDSSPKTIYPMINAGSTALPWEPYTGGQPSPNPDYPQEIEIPGSDKEIRVELKAANLIPLNENEEKTQYGVTFKQNADGSVTINGQNTGEANSVYNLITNDALLARQFAKIGMLYLSGNKAGTNVTLQCWNYDGNNSAVKDNGEGISFVFTNVTAPYNIALVVPTNEIVDNVTINPMLNAGTTALPWAPYKDQPLTLSTPNGLPGLLVDSGGNYTDSNGQQWICDSVEFYSDGTGKKIQRLKRASGLAFKKVSYGIQEESYLYETYLSDLSENGYPPCLCTGLKYDKRILDNNLNGMYAYPKSIRARFKDSKNEQEDIEKLKTFEFLYALQTPIETDLSSEEIAAYRALKLNNPVTNVFTAESLMPGIAVDYVPETERYIEKSINDNTQKAPAIVEKASGETLNVTDSSDLKPKRLKVFGKSEQLKTTGAQLFDANKLESKQSDGITITNNGDGSFTINGTSTGYPGTSYNTALENGMYYISTKDEVDVKNIFRVRIRKNDSYEDKGVGTSFKIDGTEDQVQIYIQADTGLTFNNVVIYPMLNAGSTALPWEPYTGRKPSPSPEYPQEIKIPGSDGSLEVRVFGVQLITKTYTSATINGITYTVNDDGSVTANGKATSNSFFLLSMLPKANDVFLSGGKSESISIVYTNMVNKGYKDVGNGIYIPNQFDYEKYPNSRIQIQITEGATVTNEIIRPMLNAGSTALPWEPCKLQPLTLSTPNGLPGIPVDSGGNYMDAEGQEWVCDEVDFKAEKYIRRVYTETVSLSAQEGEGGVRYVGKTTYVPGRIEAISSTLQYNRVAGYTTNGVRAVVNNNDIQVVAHYEDKILTEIDLVYVLKTPIETDLTSEEIAAYRALHTNYSTTNVFTDSDPQVGLEMEYVADTKSYIDKKFEELQKALVNTNTQVLNKVIMEDIEHA
ncbi:Uncharacterised protein [Blautia hydrogenotrophica]|uniref:hypothetical protein n=2 Tax=Blautia hydrogenotrophica TaxID=53443 RepID=UPI0006C29104|nr:hypothetical protein [Blautia hydrogenotrophica]CUM74039.1 Uncharacterised protein [Blautia hydrogenotrophica]